VSVGGESVRLDASWVEVRPKFATSAFWRRKSPRLSHEYEGMAAGTEPQTLQTAGKRGGLRGAPTRTQQLRSPGRLGATRLPSRELEKAGRNQKSCPGANEGGRR